MRVIVLGTRGFPNVQGGVETHCQELYPRLAKLGCDVTVITRTPYIPKQNRTQNYKGVEMKYIFAPKSKNLEAITHTVLGVLYARLKNPDILHIHAIGPSIIIPFAKLLGLKIIMTHHGPDYDREKWGRIAKKFLKLGEKLGTLYADKIIVISKVIKGLIETNYKRYDSELIYNGVNIRDKTYQRDYIHSLGLERGKYIIGVGRFVPEKGFHDLIDAFYQINQSDYKLVLVGDADHETEYSRRLKRKAIENGAVLTGLIKGEQLNQIFSHASLFVIPSYHEGLPITLLEAMSYNLNVLVSDIPANLELKLKKDDYFLRGNVSALKNKLQGKLTQKSPDDYSKVLAARYNWDDIVKQTYKVYQELLNR